MLAALLSALWLLDSRPPLSDAERLPPLEAIDQLVKFNKGCQCWLEDRRNVDHLNAEEIHTALVDLRWREQVWVSAQWARSTLYASHLTCCEAGDMRRNYLADLRQLIGEEDYYAGRWPAHVPWWRFRQVGR